MSAMEKVLSPSEITPTPEDRPSIKQLLEVMRIKDIDITTRWRYLGLELVDSNKILKVIEANHPNDVDTCCREMFEKWLEKTPDASWKQLITALNNIEMNTPADVISKRLKSENLMESHLHAQKLTESNKEFVTRVEPVVVSGESNEHAAAPIEGTTNVSFSNYDDISQAFSHLTAEVSKLLKSADFFALRRAIVQQRKVPRGVQFPDDLHQSIKATQNLDALLDVLADSDYWSWVDLRLLETLITSSGIEEAKILIQKYKDAIFSKKLSDILDKLLLPQQKEHKEAYTSKVGTKILKEPNEITVGDLSHYCNILEAVIMDINSGSCVLEHLDKGCLEIHWLIPVHFRFHAYKSALNNRHKFCDIHLQYLQIEPYPPIYNPFTIQPAMLSTLLHLPKPIASTPVEVIDHYYCFLADNLDNSVICQTMLKLEVISEKDVINSTKMSSEYRQNAFLLDLLLVTASTSIDEFCHLLQNTKNQQQLGDMLVNAIKSIPADDVDAVTDRQSSSTPSHPTSCEEDSTDISPVCQPEVFLAAKTAHLRFLNLTTKLRQNLKTYDPKRFLAACNKLRAIASHLEAISLQVSEDLDNDEVFRRLSFMWTWNNHSILRSLLEACDCQDGITMLDDFESQIDTNLPMELFPIPPPSMKMAPFLSSAFTVLSIRSEQYEDELAPLQYVNDVATIMIEKFGISSHALQLLAARGNPLMLYWMILKSIVHLISEGVNKYLDFLKEMRFSEITIYPNTILFAVDNLSHGSFALLSSQPQICYQCKHLKNELRHKINALEVLKKQGNDVTDQTQGQMTITEATDEDILEALKDESDLSDIKSTEQSIIEIEELRKENELSPKSADNVLLLKDLPKKFKENNLELYIDEITGLKYDEDDYTYDIKQYEGDIVVLVTFNAEADLDDIIDEILKKPFTEAGHYIKAEKVPACTSMIIKNLPPDKCDEDTLDLYFKKSGADQCKSIEILANDTAVVDFEDEQSLQKVLSKDHKWLGKEIVMYRHDFLSRLAETSSPEKVPPDSPPPAAPLHVVSNESFQKSITKNMVDLCKSQLSSLESSLREFCASVTIDEGGCITVDPVSGNESITDWKENCSQLLDDWLLNFDEKEMHIPSALHDKIFRLIVKFQNESLITVTFVEDKSLLHAIGTSDEVAEFVKKVTTLRDAELIETEDITLDEKIMIFITKIWFKELSQAHPEVKFISKDKTVLQVEGNKLGREKILQHLYGLQFFCEPLQVSQLLINFLSLTDAGKAIVQVSLQGYESNTVTLAIDGCFYIIGTNKSIITKLLAVIQSKIGEKRIKAPSQFKNICHDHNWISLCTEIQSSLSVLIVVSPTEDHVIIAGDTTKLNASTKRVEQFFFDECYGKERIALKSGQWKYLSRYAIMWLSRLVSKAESKYVGFQQPKEDDKNPTVVLEGDPDAIGQISAELQTLIATICTNNPPLVVSRPGTVRYLVSEDGQTMISGIETRERSCIHLSVETQSNSVEASKAARATARNNEKCKATTGEGKVITLVMGDITECTVDVIVNAANGQLDHADGVAGAIVRKGGRIIQEESNRYIQNEGRLFDGDAVMMKEVGTLPCQRLVHAVGPRWNGGDKDEEEFLKNACSESLKLASNYRSIAFPAISAGIYGFPAAACAHCMIEAFTSWSMENGLSTLHDIHVIVNDIVVANAFTEEMQKHGQLKVLPQFLKSADIDTFKEFQNALSGKPMTSKKTKNQKNTPSNNLSSKSPAVAGAQQPDLVFSAGRLTIEILCGDITEDASDAVVNPTNDRIRLKGGVGKALLKKAGKELENSLDREISRGFKLEEGKVFITKSSGALKCKYIYHVVSPDCRKANTFSKTITACLKKADEQKLSSISFPAIGTAGAFRPADAAQYICEAIIKYGHSNPRHLQHVRIILFQQDTYQIFIQTCNNILQSSQPGFLSHAYNYIASVFSSSHDAYPAEHGEMHNNKSNRKDYRPEQSINTPQSQTFHDIPDNAVLHIQVFAGSKDVVQQTEGRLQKVIQDHFKVDSIDNDDDDRISKLTREQILGFEEKAKDHQVEFKFEPSLKRILFKGDREDVNEVKTQILNVLSKIAVQGGDEKAAKMFQDKMTWKWQDDDDIKVMLKDSHDMKGIQLPAAQNTVLKQLKLLGDFSKCCKQELEKELPKYFEEYYGSVSDLELCDSGTAVLTLNVKDESVIEEILKDEHEVTGVKLSVEVMDEEEEEPALATIMIDGITSKIDEDNLEMYFSSKRKSGGGEIESGGVQIDETKGYVTFCDPQVAARVVDKSQHAIKRQTLQVSLYIPPKPEPPPKHADNMLLLKDLPEKFKENNLELYIDGITDLEYDEDEYTYAIKQYEGDTVVLVTFNYEADLDDIIDEISKKPFAKAGQYIKAEKVPLCTSVIIKNIAPYKCDEDTLDLYFSNKKKSGADQYKSMKILANDTAVVDFEDELTLQRVLTKDHNWLGKEVVVKRYDFLSCLSET